jgi:hypothetical protein
MRKRRYSCRVMSFCPAGRAVQLDAGWCCVRWAGWSRSRRNSSLPPLRGFADRRKGKFILKTATKLATFAECQSGLVSQILFGNDSCPYGGAVACGFIGEDDSLTNEQCVAEAAILTTIGTCGSTAYVAPDRFSSGRSTSTAKLIIGKLQPRALFRFGTSLCSINAWSILRY